MRRLRQAVLEVMRDRDMRGAGIHRAQQQCLMLFLLTSYSSHGCRRCPRGMQPLSHLSISGRIRSGGGSLHGTERFYSIHEFMCVCVCECVCVCVCVCNMS